MVVGFSLLMVLTILLGQCEAGDWKLLFLLFPVPRVRCVCMHAGLLVQQLRRYLPSSTSIPGSIWWIIVAARSGRCICAVT